MIDLPTKAQVHCTDGIAGQSTHIVGNPINNVITHLVIQNNLPPFHDYLVPIDEIEESTSGRIKLKCTRDDLNKMEPFEFEEYIRTQLPGYLRWDGVPAIPGFTTEPVTAFIPRKCRNVPQGELDLRLDGKLISCWSTQTICRSHMWFSSSGTFSKPTK
jgi:hypothetical protein